MCYDHMVCEEECCHDLEFGIPYCCSKYTGFIYLGLMIGGGVIIAILVIACYMCMKRTERELEAAAKLEAAKAVNNACSRNVLDTPPTDQNNHAHLQTQHPDVNPPPPAYHDVMRTFTRCHSCDITMATSAQSVEIMNALVRQYSEGSHAPLRGLPVLVDIQELISRHRREHGGLGQATETGLPPINSQDTLENKLPSYEDCTRRNMEVACRNRECSWENEMDRGDNKPLSQVLSTLGGSYDCGCHGETQRGVEHRNKILGESNVYFENVSETFLNTICEGSVRNRFVQSQIREGVEAEEPEEMIVNTDRREWVQGAESQVIVETEIREWVEEAEPQVRVNTDMREWVEEAEPQVRVNTDMREWVEEAEPQVRVNRDMRELVEEAEPQVIVHTEIRDLVQEARPNKMVAKAETKQSVEEIEPRNEISNAEASNWAGNTEAEELILNTEIRIDHWINKATYIKASEEIGSRETKQKIEDAEIREETEQTRDRVKESQVRTEIENAQTGQGIKDNIVKQYVRTTKVRDDIDNAETRQGKETTEYITDIETKAFVNWTQVREEIENTEINQELENAEIVEQIVNAEITVFTTDSKVRESADNVQTERGIRHTEKNDITFTTETRDYKTNTKVREEIVNIGTKEIISGIKEEIQLTETREQIEDVKIREGITDTEKREGIGDTGTIQVRLEVNRETRERITSEDKIDNTELRNTTASREIRERMVDTEINEIGNSEIRQDNETIKRTEDTDTGESINDAELHQKQLETQVKQVIMYSESETLIVVTETEIKKGITHDERKGEVSQNKTVDEETSDSDMNGSFSSKRKRRRNDTKRRVLVSDAIVSADNLTYLVEDCKTREVNKNIDMSPEENTDAVGENQNMRTNSMASCDVVDSSLSEKRAQSREEDKTHNSETASFQYNVKFEDISPESTNI